MNNTEILGYIAAFLTTLSFVPQAIKIIKTKETKGISLSMYVIFTIGISIWTVYGTLLNSNPMIFANLITLILAGIILYYKIKDEKKSK